MKKILLSIGSIIFAIAILIGATGAFMADNETSTGNTFASGVVDLKVDNESYITNDLGTLVFSTSTSWSLSPLAGKLFFNFSDIKPGDIGEDTISLHVNNNNAWMCMNVNLTATPENGQNDPEMIVDPTAGTNDGELQNELNFAFWADDGDNVYEQSENIFKQGSVKNIFTGENWAIADSQTNIWGTPGPVLGNSTKYIAKAWCFGPLVPAAKAQDGQGKTGSNGPLARGTGFSCNGGSIGNITQSDGIKADVSFSVVQSRGNSGFTCAAGSSTSTPPTSTSTLLSDNFDGYSERRCDDGQNDQNWDQEGGVYYRHLGNGHGKVAELDGHGVNGTKEILTTKKLNLTGYHDVQLKYDRRTEDDDAPPNPVGPQTLTVEYSVNDGSTWTLLETVTGESAWTTKTFSLSPSADNKSAVKIRFVFSGQNTTNNAYIDNVTVTAVTP